MVVLIYTYLLCVLVNYIFFINPKKKLTSFIGLIIAPIVVILGLIENINYMDIYRSGFTIYTNKKSYIVSFQKESTGFGIFENNIINEYYFNNKKIININNNIEIQFIFIKVIFSNRKEE
jgi:hypothetical protein